MDSLISLSEQLNISFHNLNLIRQAFIHRSYLNESKGNFSSNERLEFLGDSILSYLVSDFLFTSFPEFTEGELTNLRSSLVNTKSLAAIAQKLKLGNYLYLSKGEEESGGRENLSLLADTFEALLGVVYLDLGIVSAKKILKQLLFPLIEKIIEDKSYKDAKSTFQEVVQEATKISPVYRVINEEGPDHAKRFTVGVYVNHQLIASGTGRNKQDAEKQAASSALEKWVRR